MHTGDYQSFISEARPFVSAGCDVSVMTADGANVSLRSYRLFAVDVTKQESHPAGLLVPRLTLASNGCINANMLVWVYCRVVQKYEKNPNIMNENENVGLWKGLKRNVLWAFESERLVCVWTRTLLPVVCVSDQSRLIPVTHELWLSVLLWLFSASVFTLTCLCLLGL